MRSEVRLTRADSGDQFSESVRLSGSKNAETETIRVRRVVATRQSVIVRWLFAEHQGLLLVSKDDLRLALPKALHPRRRTRYPLFVESLNGQPRGRSRIEYPFDRRRCRLSGSVLQNRVPSNGLREAPIYPSGTKPAWRQSLDHRKVGSIVLKEYRNSTCRSTGRWVQRWQGLW